MLSGSVKADVLTDGSFEGGASSWKFGIGGSSVAVDASWVGKWATSQSNEDQNMDLADASQVVATQNTISCRCQVLAQL